MTTNNRTARSEETREKTAKRKPWAPPSRLDAPPAPEGFIHRWIRMGYNGKDDTKNMSARLREGFEPVRAEDYPDFALPTIEDGRYAGCIAVGDLMLAKFPIETQKERTEYYRQRSSDQIKAVDNDLFREEDSVMPISKPERKSSTSFGGPRPKTDE